MDSINLNPLATQDLMNYDNGIMPNIYNPFMGGMYNTNLLGRVHFAPQPDSDKFFRMQEKEEKDKKTFLKSIVALGVILGAGALLFKGKPAGNELLKKPGNNFLLPFKWIGRATQNTAKKVGHYIAAPFKWLKNKIKVKK